MNAKRNRILARGVNLLVILILALSMAGIQTQSALAVSTLDVNNADLACNDITGNPYCTIQAAIDAASPDDTIHVYPGSYNETAANRTVLVGTPREQGLYQFGLFFPNNKPGISLIGVDSFGSPITDPDSADLPYITTNATNNFG